MKVVTYIALACVLVANIGYAQSRDTDLNVAVFAYLPDASTAVEKLEETFERRYASIDLDLELWNPYDDAFEDDGLSRSWTLTSSRSTHAE